MQVALSMATESTDFTFNTIGRYPSLREALKAMSQNPGEVTFDKDTGVFRNITTNFLYKVRNVSGKEISPSYNSLAAAKIKNQGKTEERKQQEQTSDIEEDTSHETTRTHISETDSEPEFKVDWLTKQANGCKVVEKGQILFTVNKKSIYIEAESIEAPHFQIGIIEGANLRLALKFKKNPTKGDFKLTKATNRYGWCSTAKTVIEQLNKKMLAYKIINKNTFQGKKNEKMGCYILSLT